MRDPITFRQLAPLVGVTHQRISQLAEADPAFPKVKKIGPSKVVSLKAALAYFDARDRKAGRPRRRR